MNKLIATLCLLGIVFLIDSCEYNNEEELYPKKESSSNCDTTSITYASGIETIILDNCALSDCHDGNSGLATINDYSSVKNYVDNGLLEQLVLVQKDMPPSGPLSTCNQQKIRSWLMDGAPQN